jgi:DNA-binding winged helix-turn-helix (wHTH) protein/Flp pilus assembly protein TadD
MAEQSREVYSFGEFQLEPVSRRLLRDGAVVPLAPKAFDLLLALVEAEGHTVTKDALLAQVWPGLYVEEANLPQNISLVRKALAESPQDHRFIVTVPGTGYRFAAPVTKQRGAGTAAPPDSVAVLPFENVSGDPSLDYLGDGLTEGLIASLSRVGRLRVKARAIVFRMRGTIADPQAAGRELGVAAVVTGRLRGATLQVELIDVATGFQRWSATFDVSPSQSLALQEAIARDVVRELPTALTTEEQGRVAAQQTRSSPAYQCYLKGRYFLNKRLTETLDPAIRWFREATDHDPGFALAYVGMADTYALQTLYGAMRPRDVFPLSRAAALQALELDETLAEAHNSLAVVELFYAWNFNAAEAEFRRAIALNPGYADAHQRYGLLLTASGRFDEARQALATAQALDPLSLIISTLAAYPDYYGGHPADAVDRLARVIQIDADFSMAHYRRALALVELGRLDEAEAELQVSLKLSNDRDVLAALARVWALQGRTAEAHEALAELDRRAQQTFVSPYMAATVHAALGDLDRAFQWMQRAIDERSYWLIYLSVDPALKHMRNDPRFDGLTAQLRRS